MAFAGAVVVVVSSIVSIPVAPPAAHATIGASPYDASDGTLDTGVTQIPDINTGCIAVRRDDIFVGGLKLDDLHTQPPPVIDLGTTTGKGDLCDTYAAVAVGSDGHMYLYIAWTRAATNGATTVVFELNQVATTCTNPTNGTPDR